MYTRKALLLNASNMDEFPVYPYAFIQVPAIASQAGVNVICQDLLGIPQEKWEQTVQALIERHDPTMILIPKYRGLFVSIGVTGTERE